METFLRRSQESVQNLDQLQELGVLYESSEVKSKIGLYLSRFDFTLKHVASKSISRADSFSRRDDWAEEVERDNENQVMLKKKWLEIRAIEKG